MAGDAYDDIEMIQEIEELERRDAEGDPGAREALTHWVLTSPRHVQVYLKHSMANVELTALDESKHFDLEQMIHGIL